MTLDEYLVSQGLQARRGDNNEVIGWENRYNEDSSAGVQDAINRFQQYQNNPAALFNKNYDPALMQALHGTAGYVAPVSQSAYGNGGGHGSLMSLEDYYQSLVPSGNGDMPGLSMSATPEQAAARAAFEAAHPGMYQLSPDQVSFQNGQIGLKGAGASVGQYVQDPSKVTYDPTYGYITNIGNDAVAGQPGGWNGWLPLSMIAGAGLGIAGSLGGLGTGVQAALEGASAGATSLSDLAAGIPTSEFTGGASGGALAGEGATVGAGAGAGAGAGSEGALGGLLGGASGGEVAGGIGGELSGVGAGVSGAGSAIGRILDGTGTASDWAQVLGGAGSAVLGAVGANAQGNAYSDIVNKYLALGAPSRARLEASYAPGYDPSVSDVAYKGALEQSANAAARATSARSGNPVDNPGAYAEMQKYITNSTALPYLQNYRSQNAASGGLGVAPAAANDSAAAGQTSGVYNALGYGLGQMTQPQSQYGGALSKMLLNSSQYL